MSNSADLPSPPNGFPPLPPGFLDNDFPSPNEFPPVPPIPEARTIAVAAIVAPLVSLVIVIIVIICCYLARKEIVRCFQTVFGNASPAPPQHFPVQELDAPTMEMFLRKAVKEKPVRFTAQQLCTFTNNYSTKIGSGGFGVVYKGHLPNGIKIAVKVINNGSEMRAAEEQFMAEVSSIGKTYHINLVRLYGFCYDQYMSALVYEYMENGSLDKYLFSQEHAIGWEKLHDIAVGIAKGIAYLHEECQDIIIHYDIKPGNVLLDADFFPKVADFGLAKLCSRDNTHITVSGYRGTPGYSAPEFLLKNYPITHKCDIYSFGMLLFEIVARRRNTSTSSSGSLDWFPKHVWEEYEKGELATMLIACGIEEKDKDKAERMCLVALWCAQDSPVARPPMSAVVKMLEGGVEIMQPPKPFHYLQSIGMNAIMPVSSGEETSSIWYRETTPVMAKYEIQVATC